MKMTDYTSQTIHEGGMRCRTVYSPSQDSFATDVAADLGGLGKHPSPADMLASCVASCMLSMIAYTGQNKGFATDGICIRAACGEGKRGIGSIRVDIEVPAPVSPEARRLMEAAVASCPVGNALHPDIKKEISWRWAD